MSPPSAKKVTSKATLHYFNFREKKTENRREESKTKCVPNVTTAVESTAQTKWGKLRTTMNSPFFFTLWIITPSFCAPSKPEIYIAGLFPISGTRGEGDIGRGVLPAVNLALEHVNAHQTILPHHELKLIHNDTKVSGLHTNTFISTSDGSRIP